MALSNDTPWHEIGARRRLVSGMQLHPGDSNRESPAAPHRGGTDQNESGTTRWTRPEGCIVKTMAIRLDDDQHAQLGMIAKLEELTVTDAIRQAIDQWIESRRSNPELQARAEAVLDDIDRDAATRRGAIAALLGDTASTTGPRGKTAPTRGRTSRSKGGDDASS